MSMARMPTTSWGPQSQSRCTSIMARTVGGTSGSTASTEASGTVPTRGFSRAAGISCTALRGAVPTEQDVSAPAQTVGERDDGLARLLV
jgi:hypothetical protein